MNKMLRKMVQENDLDKDEIGRLEAFMSIRKDAMEATWVDFLFIGIPALLICGIVIGVLFKILIWVWWVW